MELIDNCIQLKYLGRDSGDSFHQGFLFGIPKDNYTTVTYPYDYYEASLNINGQDVVFVLEAKAEAFTKSGKIDYDNIHKTLGLLGITTEKNPKFEFCEALETDTEIGKAGETIDFNIAEATLDLNVPYKKNLEKKNLSEIIIKKLYGMKREALVNTRKEEFNQKREEFEREYLEYTLSNILSQLDEEKRQKAQELYDKMMECVLTGKYNFKNYEKFMGNLNKVCNGQKAFISEYVYNAIRNGYDYGSTFLPFSKKRIANSTKQMCDIRYAGQGECTIFTTVEITPLTDEEKAVTSFGSAIPLGKIERFKEAIDIYRWSYHEHDIEDYKKKGDILIFSDANEDFIFMSTQKMKELRRKEISMEEIENRTKSVDVKDKKRIEEILNDEHEKEEGKTNG